MPHYGTISVSWENMEIQGRMRCGRFGGRQHLSFSGGGEFARGKKLYAAWFRGVKHQSHFAATQTRVGCIDVALTDAAKHGPVRAEV